MSYTRFEAIQMGDTVARIAPSGWAAHSITKHTVTRKTATQIIIDNGERYTRHLRRVGDGQDSYRYQVFIEPWTPETDSRLSEMAEEQRKQRVIQRLEGISWRKVSADIRDKTYAALQEMGVWDKEKTP